MARVVLGDVQPLLSALGAAVVLLLAIACFNVGNLLLVRGAARSHELSIRRAIGASDAAIIQQMLIESAMLSGAGGLAGCGLAYLVTPVMLSLIGDSVPRAADAEYKSGRDRLEPDLFGQFFTHHSLRRAGIDRELVRPFAVDHDGREDQVERGPERNWRRVCGCCSRILR